MNVATAEKWTPDVPARYIAQVVNKLSGGVYATEKTHCFCGIDPPDDVVIVERDRYSIPHRMVMCRNCAILRANPRMTQPAYDQFYNEEYRPIYDGWQFEEKSIDRSAMFSHDVDWGNSFRGFIEYFGLKPKSVIDIGCNLGGMLLPFKDDGARVCGIEVCSDAIRWGEKIGIPVFKSIEYLKHARVKADLVIMQDVLEHLLDLNYLANIPQILNPEGMLYIGLPGLFRKRLATLFQNAHVWQFVSETLHYVLSSFHFEPVFLDEDIASLWVYNESIPKIAPPKEYCIYIREHLEQKEKRLMPPVMTYVNTPTFKRYETIEKNLASKFPDISAIRHSQKGDVIIVGGGPSVDDEIDTIRELHAKGYPIISIERMYPRLVELGLTPDYVASLDGNNDVPENFVNIQPDTIHLVGCTTHQKVGELLKEAQAKTYIFSIGNHIPDLHEKWYQNGYTKITLVSTGGSITLTSIYLALLLGFRDVHLFGCDCMIKPDKAYATGITGKSVNRTYFDIEIDGEIILSCASFVSFARQFFMMVERARKAGQIDSIKVYGESLINKMWDKGVGSWQTSQPATRL